MLIVRSVVPAAKCVSCELRQHSLHRQFRCLPRIYSQTFSKGNSRRSITQFLFRPNVIKNGYRSSIKENKCSKIGLCLLPFSLFKRNKPDTVPELCPDVLANIPREVFKKEIFSKVKPKRNFIIGFIISVWEGTSFFLRFLRICFTFGPLLCLYPVAWLSPRFCVYWRNWLLLAMEYTGPTFIKLGQWAGTRRDIFSPEFCDLCTKLHDSTRQHAFYITKRKLRKAFGKRWRRIFEKIEKVPIGSGCIAQVHRAYMKAAMIPDESIIQEVMSLEDTDEPDIDFAEGFEILGFSKINSYLEDREDMMSPTGSDLSQSDNTGPQAMDKQMPEPEKDEESSVIETVGGKILDPEKMTTLPTDSVEIVTQIDEEHLSPIQTEEETLIPVAVKVLHPGVRRQVHKDLAILRCCAWLAEWVFPSLRWISVRESMEEFAQLMIRQIDLRYEADNMEKFVQNFESNPHVRFPRPVRPYCKSSVIVETLEDGEPMNIYLQDDGAQLDITSEQEVDSQPDIKKRIASIGVEALLQMIFIDNLVHGDLHPGNILIQNAAVDTTGGDDKLILIDVGDTVIVSTKPVDNPLRLVILDTGITSSLSDRDRENFKSVFTAVVIGEGEEVADLILKHARHSECSDVTSFKRELAALVTSFREQTIKLGKIQVGDLLSQVFTTCSHHKVKMESNFAAIMLAIFVLEGLGRSLDPDLDILEKAKPLLLS